jgi:hypothetical protein
MRPEAGRRGQGSCGEPASARGVADDQEKENETEEREQGIGTGLRRVKKEERNGGRKPYETPAGASGSKCPGAGEEDRERQKREHARRRVRERERLGGRDEGLLEKVEERRPGVRTEDADELGRREPRSPDSEDLIVPERSRDEQPEASGNGKGGSDQCGGQSEALAVVTLSFDALS